jgi:hypothetical protein
MPDRPIQFTLVSSATGEKVITVFIPGEPMPFCADSSHPNFERITMAVVAGEQSGLPDLFDTSRAVAERFERLSERVTVAHGRIFFDGDQIDNVLTTQVLRFLNEGVENWKPLIAFFEKVQSNPSDESREQLYEWLRRYDFTIAPDGDLVGYKGVKIDDEGNFVSIHAGPAIVDGEAVNGNVPNHVGAVVEIARSQVTADSAVGCSSGLHVGTRAYAESWSREVGAVMEVRVNPRDVVSVPTHCDAQKVRVCRYKVVAINNAQYAQPVTSDDVPETDDDAVYFHGFRAGSRVRHVIAGAEYTVADSRPDNPNEYGYSPETLPLVTSYGRDSIDPTYVETIPE